MKAYLMICNLCNFFSDSLHESIMYVNGTHLNCLDKTFFIKAYVVGTHLNRLDKTFFIKAYVSGTHLNCFDKTFFIKTYVVGTHLNSLDFWTAYMFLQWSRLGWLGEANGSCILHHWAIQMILVYSRARPAILAAGKGRGGMFLFLLFLHFCSFFSFLPAPLFNLVYYLLSLLSHFSLSLGDDTKWPKRVDMLIKVHRL